MELGSEGEYCIFGDCEWAWKRMGQDNFKIEIWSTKRSKEFEVHQIGEDRRPNSRMLGMSFHDYVRSFGDCVQPPGRMVPSL